MRRIRIHRPSPAMGVALLALFVALGGTSYAAAKIGAGQIRTGAVGARAVKNRALTSLDIRKDSLGGATIREQRLDPAKLNVKRLKTVPSAGLAGRVGKNGVGAGSLRTITRRFGPAAGVENGKINNAVAKCNKGEVALSGGAHWSTEVPGEAIITSFAQTPDSWTVVASNASGVARSVQAEVLCLAP